MQSKSIISVAVVTGLLLLIPLTLQITIGTGVDGQGFNWKLGDFVVVGILLFGTGLAIEFIVKKFNSSISRTIAIAVIVVAFLLVWAELAVGIFGTPFAGS